MTTDFEGHRIILENKSIWLTNIQNQLLEILYNNQEKVVKYEEIASKIYETECDEDLKALIRRHMTLLRKKVSKYIKIKTVRDVGYIIEEDLR